jgi:16S rRNA (uracil1498-N3)-methyltransferase
MTVPYFFIDRNSISDNRAILAGNDFRHLVKVLRAQKGDPVELSDENGFRYYGNLGAIAEDTAEIIISSSETVSIRIPEIFLFQCILKKEAMEYAIQKTAEIGADCFTPVTSLRTVAEPEKDRLENRLKRWQQIALSASMQCKRNFVMKILSPLELKKINPENFDIFLLPVEVPGLQSIRILPDFLGGNKIKNIKKIAFLTGPEGGFDESEISYLTGAGAVLLNFGSNILRAETSSVYLLSIIDYLLKL